MTDKEKKTCKLEAQLKSKESTLETTLKSREATLENKLKSKNSIPRYLSWFIKIEIFIIFTYIIYVFSVTIAVFFLGTDEFMLESASLLFGILVAYTTAALSCVYMIPKQKKEMQEIFVKQQKQTLDHQQKLELYEHKEMVKVKMKAYKKELENKTKK